MGFPSNDVQWLRCRPREGELAGAKDQADTELFTKPWFV